MPRWPNISKYCGEDFDGAEASAIERAKLSPSIAICGQPAICRRRTDADQIEQRRHEVAGVHELVAQLALAAIRFGQFRTKGSRMPPPWVFCL